MKIHISGFDARQCDAEIVRITVALKSSGHDLAGPVPLPVRSGRHHRVLHVHANETTAAVLSRLQLTRGVLAEIGIV